MRKKIVLITKIVVFSFVFMIFAVPLCARYSVNLSALSVNIPTVNGSAIYSIPVSSDTDNQIPDPCFYAMVSDTSFIVGKETGMSFYLRWCEGVPTDASVKWIIQIASSGVTVEENDFPDYGFSVTVNSENKVTVSSVPSGLPLAGKYTLVATAVYNNFDIAKIEIPFFVNYRKSAYSVIS